MLYRYCLSIALVALPLTGARAERALTRVIEVSSGVAVSYTHLTLPTKA